MIGWVRLDTFCVAPLGLTTKGLNQKVDNANLKNQSAATAKKVPLKEASEGRQGDPSTY